MTAPDAPRASADEINEACRIFFGDDQWGVINERGAEPEQLHMGITLNNFLRARQPSVGGVTEELRALIDEQAEDEGLWFQHVTITEDYLQRALRKLHAVAESALAAASPPVPEQSKPIAWRVHTPKFGWFFYTDKDDALRTANDYNTQPFPVYAEPPVEYFDPNSREAAGDYKAQAALDAKPKPTDHKVQSIIERINLGPLRGKEQFENAAHEAVLVIRDLEAEVGQGMRLIGELQKRADKAEAEVKRLRKENSKWSMGLTLGNGLMVWGNAKAIARVQDIMLIDSNHPQEKEDVRRSLARDLQKAEADLKEALKLLGAIFEAPIDEAGEDRDALLAKHKPERNDV